MEAGAGAVRGRGREAAEGTKRRRMNALNPKALGKATRRVMAFGAIAKRQLKQIEKMARKVQPAQRGRRTGGGCKSKCR